MKRSTKIPPQSKEMTDAGRPLEDRPHPLGGRTARPARSRLQMDAPATSHASAGRDARLARIAVVGLGNIGRLIADMLIERGFEVRGVDADVARAVGEGAAVIDVTDRAALEDLFKEIDAVVSCLPYYLNVVVAKAAHAAGVHYLDLTEDVATSRTIDELAQRSRATVFMPHCGLAPGFICVVGGGLATSLELVERLELRVGALPRSPNNALGYACNWSPAGIINEYLNDCEQLRGGKPASAAALSDIETLVIDGARYEAFTTSGGLGTMCETFAGRIDRLDYKTIRYPGHCRMMSFMLHELGLGRQQEQAVRLLADAYPPVRDDVVILYAAADGGRAGRRVREEFVRTYRPRIVAGAERTAIAWTTAAGAVGMLELLAEGSLPASGFVRQEDVPLDRFLATSAGRLLASEPSAEVRGGPALLSVD
jgi:saccharopine dehydrogenase-like NADP-dependent oxidoreductase